MHLPNCYLIELHGCSILEQLLLEEALLRCDNRNFCIFNYNTEEAIVLGISKKPHKDIHLHQVQKHPISIIKRYSGGGTVFVDHNTLFVSWIIQDTLNSHTPQSLLKWTAEIYAPIFPKEFAILDNDYVLDKLKIGGNAQYLQKNRYVHHTSFLWDVNFQKMSQYLQLPEKQPSYRKNRKHEEFLTTLHQLFSSKEDFFYRLKQCMKKNFELLSISPEELSKIIQKPHRQATTVLSVAS